MRHRSRLAALAVVVLASLVALPSTALAHPEHGGGGELFPGEGVVTDGDDGKQHDGEEGHLPAIQENVTVVGQANVRNPKGTTGRVADVFAYGNFAYLTAFREPVCERGGVHVMDISQLDRPKEVVSAFIRTSPGSYAGEGIQVIQIGGRDVLIHQNETCPGVTPAPGMSGGINLWDVTNPRKPVNLARHAGDYTNPDGTVDVDANTVHSMFAWTSHLTRQTYVVLVDNEEFTDVDIMNITNPTRPVLINDSLDLVDLFGVDQDSPEGLTSIFSHDMTVERIGQRYVMNMNYWDGGYVLLDVTNPRTVRLIAESDYAQLDEQRAQRGEQISPEGNAHQSEFSPNHDYLIGTDEDFNPYRVVATINSGLYAGTEYVAVQASDTPAITEATTIEGVPTFVGRACTVTEGGTITPAVGEGAVALVERGVCSFQEKLDAITAAGYDAGIVFNNNTECDGLVTMLAEGTIPFVFVSRTTGLQLLGSPTADVCGTVAAVTEMAETSVTAVFDGWGYVRLFETNIGGVGGGTIEQVAGDAGTYAIPESQDPAYASGFGDLSVHEVAMDPDPASGLAYLSYYAGGLRVVEYGPSGMTEVGVFIDEGGNNFWGVEVYERDGQTYILASDRDYGLYIFQYTP